MPCRSGKRVTDGPPPLRRTWCPEGNGASMPSQVGWWMEIENGRKGVLHPGRLTAGTYKYPTNHQFGKENDLPNLHDYVPC